MTRRILSGLLVRGYRILSQYSSNTRLYHATSKALHSNDTATTNNKIALVLGSSGSLGSTVSRYLSRELQMTVIGADLLELPNETDWQLDGFIATPPFGAKPSVATLTNRLVYGIKDFLEAEDSKIHAIICASGGWEGDADFPRPGVPMAAVEAGAEEYGSTIEKMMRMNLYPVLAANFVAQRFMAKEGLLVVMGATAALTGTPGMLGYGIAKAGAHHFIQTLGASTGTALSKKNVNKKLRKNNAYLDDLTVVGILPTMIDTASNRSTDPNADFNQWTKPTDIAREIGTWIEKPPLRPHSGSLVKVMPHPEKGEGAFFQLVR